MWPINRVTNRNPVYSHTLNHDNILQVLSIYFFLCLFNDLFVDFTEACDSIRSEIFYNILIEFGLPMKLVRLIKMLQIANRIYFLLFIFFRAFAYVFRQKYVPQSFLYETLPVSNRKLFLC
jgi:hypothetical protein